MIKVRHKDKDLWGSVSFIAPDLGETEVRLEGASEQITLLFDFVRLADKPRNLELEIEGPLVLRLRCTNYDDPLPTTVRELLPVGDFLGRRLYLVFAVSKLGSYGELHQVNLSVYLGEQIDG